MQLESRSIFGTLSRQPAPARALQQREQRRPRRAEACKAAADDAPAAAAAPAASSSAPAPPAAEPAPATPPAGEVVEEKSEEYTAEMQKKMGTSLTYRHEDGINWDHILPDLIVGSCLQTPADVDRLAEAGVTTIFNLQEDCDMDYFKIDIEAIRERCRERGDIKHVRFPVRDFDPFDLRKKLPKAVARLSHSHQPKFGIAYIHCTAGMGRAPATALAYMHWLRGWDLQEAYDHLTSTRRCSPRIEAIRAATADLLTGSGPIPVTISLWRRGTAKSAQIAGLDVGWHSRIDLHENPKTHRLEVMRELMPGSYPFKFIIDDVWSASMDYPTFTDGANTNNIITVLPRDAEDQSKRERLLSPAGALTDEEREELAAMLCPWASHDRIMHRARGASAAASAASMDSV